MQAKESIVRFEKEWKRISKWGWSHHQIKPFVPFEGQVLRGTESRKCEAERSEGRWRRTGRGGSENERPGVEGKKGMAKGLTSYFLSGRAPNLLKYLSSAPGGLLLIFWEDDKLGLSVSFTTCIVHWGPGSGFFFSFGLSSFWKGKLWETNQNKSKNKQREV